MVSPRFELSWKYVRKSASPHRTRRLCWAGLSHHKFAGQGTFSADRVPWVNWPGLSGFQTHQPASQPAETQLACLPACLQPCRACAPVLFLHTRRWKMNEPAGLSGKKKGQLSLSALPDRACLEPVLVGHSSHRFFCSACLLACPALAFLKSSDPVPSSFSPSSSLHPSPCPVDPQP